MPESNKIAKIELPMKLRFNESPNTKFISSSDAINVVMISRPPLNYKEVCYRMVMATWSDSPIFSVKKEKVNETFIQILKGETLPNSLECLQFVFLLNGITLQEVTHILRHRNFFSIHAQCSGDLWWTHHDAMIPNSILKSKFKKRYEELTIECKKFYCDMIDSKDISIMDARYILPRNLMTFYYVGMNLRDAIAFINQRKCSQIQPETDNIIAEQIYNHILTVIPEIKEIVSLKCNKNCHYVKTANTGKATNLYLPDKSHDVFDWNRHNFIYQKRRKEMGSIWNKQDE